METLFTDPTKPVLAICSVASVAFNIWQYVHTRARFKITVGIGYDINENGVGTHLCLRIGISNTGKVPTYFSYIKVVKRDGDFFYPSFSLAGGTKIEANHSEVGTIPVGHLLDHQVKSLVIYDGVWKGHSVSKRQLHKMLQELREEKLRLEKLHLR